MIDDFLVFMTILVMLIFLANLHLSYFTKTFKVSLLEVPKLVKYTSCNYSFDLKKYGNNFVNIKVESILEILCTWDLYTILDSSI